MLGVLGQEGDVVDVTLLAADASQRLQRVDALGGLHVPELHRTIGGRAVTTEQNRGKSALVNGVQLHPGVAK